MAAIVTDTDEISPELVEQLTEVGNLLKPYYQDMYDNVAVEKRNDDGVYVLTHLTSGLDEPVEIRVLVRPDGSVRLEEARRYADEFIDAADGILTDREAAEFLIYQSENFGVEVEFPGRGIYYVESNEISFSQAYSDLLNTINAVVLAAETLTQLRQIREAAGGR